MTVLSINHARIISPEKFKEYVSEASKLMKNEGVEVIARAQFFRTFEGDTLSQDVVAIFRYRDLDAFYKFYRFHDYQALIPLREEACHMTINIYEEA